MKFLNSSAISDSEDDDIAKDAFKEGVVKADDENGTKGDQEDHVYIFIFVCLLV